MGSRLRENVKQLFECFCEVAQPNGEKQPWILQRYPESYNDTEVLKSVPKFAYPCEIQNVTIQHFSFVLTSVDSKWTFGFCRHDPKTETALVVLSALPWHETFYKLLNHIATLTASSNAGDLWKFLGEVYEATLPVSGASVSIPLPDSKTTFVFQRPNQFQLPSIPENRNLTEYFSAVDSHNMMMVFASMLYERRIIFTSKRLSRLSACVQACNALIYPMIWQHIYIPVLPLTLTDYLLAPMPFLIGVPLPILERVRQSDLGEVVILNADDNTIESPFQDLESLPQDVVTNLRRALRNGPALLGDGVSRAFLRALVQLTAGYREALTLQQGQHDDHVRITFDQEAFVESRPLSMQPFLRKMLELQIFQQFIEERLHMLNSGLGFSDEFEMEACNYSDKSGSKFMQQYREWSYAMRKEGSAFIRSVKDKANPAMKLAVKSVKDKGKDMKTAYKGLKWKGRATRGENAMRFHQPRSAPSSPTTDRRPISFASPSKSPSGLTPTTSYRKELRLRNSNVETSRKQYSPLNPSSPEDQDSPPERLDIDLMHELRDVIFPNTPPVDRSLKPVRSLDSLRPGWGGRVRHGPPPSTTNTTTTTITSTITTNTTSSSQSPYEHYQIPKHLKPRQAVAIAPEPTSDARDEQMRSKQSKREAEKAPLVAEESGSADKKNVNERPHEFVNPFEEARKDEGQASTPPPLPSRLRTEDPFELYGSVPQPTDPQHQSDPFDTSQVLNPFGFPNPLFRADPPKPSPNTNSTEPILVKTQSAVAPLSSSSSSPLPSSQSSSPPLLPPKLNNAAATVIAKHHHHQANSTDVQDLIRLDSTNSDDDFDPLLSKSSGSTATTTTTTTNATAAGGNVAGAITASSSSIIHKQMSQSLHAPSSNAIELLGEGLSNPLYPYFTPQQRKSEPAAPNQSKIGDLDLLQEYGLDFNKFSLSNGNAAVAAAATASSRLISQTKLQAEANYNNSSSSGSSSSQPMSGLATNNSNSSMPFGTAFGSQQAVKSPSNWTKFE